MIDKAVADERVQAGWLRALLAFEVLAASEEFSRAALEELLARLDADERAKLYRREVSDFERREKPLKGIDVAWSGTAEIELVTKSFDELVQLVLEYGPSAAEILEPARLTIPVGEAQAILNTVSALMHRFAAAGLGGIVFVRGKEQ